MFTGRKRIGPRSVIKQGAPKLVWLRFPDGTARLARRHRVRPVLRNDKIAAELRELCIRTNIWPAGEYLVDPNFPISGEKEVGPKGGTESGRNEERQLVEIYPERSFEQQGGSGSKNGDDAVARDCVEARSTGKREEAVIPRESKAQIKQKKLDEKWITGLL